MVPTMLFWWTTGIWIAVSGFLCLVLSSRKEKGSNVVEVPYCTSSGSETAIIIGTVIASIPTWKWILTCWCPPGASELSYQMVDACLCFWYFSPHISPWWTAWWMPFLRRWSLFHRLFRVSGIDNSFFKCFIYMYPCMPPLGMTMSNHGDESLFL